MEAFFLVKRHGAVEDGLAADPACGDAGIVERRLRGIEDVPAYAWQKHGVEIALKERFQRAPFMEVDPGKFLI